LGLVKRGELDPAGIFIARAKDRLIGTVVSLPVPGASGLIWPPQAVSHPCQSAIKDQLVRHACRWLRGKGIRLVQALLAQAEVPYGEALLQNGFALVTRLWYLRHRLDKADGPAEPLPRLRFQTYARCDHSVFDRTLLRTYEESRDCPEITGIRTIDQIIEGHKAQGLHDPDFWWLASDEAGPAGVLLLTALPEGPFWDISYLGVLPEKRRRGYGAELTRKALDEAVGLNALQLTLSVDDRNMPARRLYRNLGFEPYDQREVYLAIWDK
jgi:ribosomal protein S18 acetylase RimI-like enzyme